MPSQYLFNTLRFLSRSFKTATVQKGISLDKSQLSPFRVISYSRKYFIAISLKTL